MGIEGIFIPKENINYYQVRLDTFKFYENDPSFNTTWISNRIIYPVIPTDISLVAGDKFTYFDEYINKSYKITLNRNELPGDKIERTIKFTNPPFNKQFMIDPSFNLNNYDDQQEIYMDYYNILNYINKKAYYRIEDITFPTYVDKSIVYKDESNNEISIEDISNNSNLIYYEDISYTYITDMIIYIGVYNSNNIKLKNNGKMIHYDTYTINNINKNIDLGNIWKYGYNCIKPIILDEITNKIKNNELLSYLDISPSLNDVFE